MSEKVVSHDSRAKLSSVYAQAPSNIFVHSESSV